jgi:hypothetical protein
MSDHSFAIAKLMIQLQSSPMTPLAMQAQIIDSPLR